MLANTKPLGRAEAGFTVTELLVAMVVISILIASIFTVFVSYFNDLIRNNAQAQLSVESQTILRTIVEELREGAGVQATNSITDLNSPGGGWTTSNENVVIIIAVPVLDSSDEYVIDLATGFPYQNELVYFENDGQLFRRTLANTEPSQNNRTTTCPTDIAGPGCPEDTKLTNYFDEMVFEFYDQDNDVTTNPALARSIEMEINLLRKTTGEPIIANNVIRITLRNRLV